MRQPEVLGHVFEGMRPGEPLPDHLVIIVIAGRSCVICSAGQTPLPSPAKTPQQPNFNNSYGYSDME